MTRMKRKLEGIFWISIVIAAVLFGSLLFGLLLFEAIEGETYEVEGIVLETYYVPQWGADDTVIVLSTGTYRLSEEEHNLPPIGAHVILTLRGDGPILLSWRFA